MATIIVSSSCARKIGSEHPVSAQSLGVAEQSIFLARLAEAVLRIPPYIQVYCSSPTGLDVHGLLRSVCRTGLQVLVPVSLPLRDILQVTVAHCSAVSGVAVRCVARSSVYQVDIAFSSLHIPEISIGSPAVVQSLDEPATVTRCTVRQVGSTHCSIFCKTSLAPGIWVRVEASGWILFGLVEGVVSTNGPAGCVNVRLQAALPAAATDRGEAKSEDCENSLSMVLRSMS